MVRIVLVTGSMAYDVVSEIAKRISDDRLRIYVLKLPIPVAAMMTAEYLLRELPRHISEIAGSDLVIVPGQARGDMSLVSKALGVKVVKGTQYAYDIPLMIDALKRGVELSPLEPADNIIISEKKRLDEGILESLRESAQRDYYFKIGDIPVSRHYPIVFAEVYFEGDVSKTLMKAEKLAATADVLIFGFPISAPHDVVLEVLRKARSLLRKPVGIDTPSIEIACEVLSAGLNVYLSLTSKTLRNICEWNKETAAVIIPETTNTSIKDLEEAVKIATERGIEKLILDPVLSPPMLGLTKSISRYIEARNVFPDKPLLMGVGNVTELLDADSPGVNALLASIGVELEVEIFLTTEHSVKTRGAVNELKRALDMAVLARERKSPPKDLSVNLLMLKDKRRKVAPPPSRIDVIASKTKSHKTDPRGFFKIHADHERGLIIVEHYSHGSQIPDIVVAGKEPYEILLEIKERNIVGEETHFWYLAIELEKARIALKTGKEYVQDRDLFE